MLIHYCWFGSGKKSELIKKCIHSWREFCPDAEIIEWNENNFDVNCCTYVKEAYARKKWAFVSDYCRYYVLYHFGGIYLDTDVELIRKLEGLPETFVGFEYGAQYVSSALIRGAKKRDKICGMMLASYEDDRFILGDGSLNMRTVGVRETEIFLKAGLKQKDYLQHICGTVIYPTEYFCPYNFFSGQLKITKKTYSIHHYEASWLTAKQKDAVKLANRLSNYLPTKMAYYLSLFYKSIEYDGVFFTLKKTIRILIRNLRLPK